MDLYILGCQCCAIYSKTLGINRWRQRCGSKWKPRGKGIQRSTTRRHCSSWNYGMHHMEQNMYFLWFWSTQWTYILTRWATLAVQLTRIFRSPEWPVCFWSLSDVFHRPLTIVLFRLLENYNVNCVWNFYLGRNWVLGCTSRSWWPKVLIFW